MANAADKRAYDSLVQKIKTKPFDPEAPVIPPPTSYEAMVGIGDDLSAERDAENPERNKLAPKLWEGIT